MNDKIKAHLVKHNESKGYSTTDDDLMEIIEESKTLWQGSNDRHRWYTLIPTVVEIDGMFLQYDQCDVQSEESSVEDCVGDATERLKNVIEVSPKEVKTIIYEPVQE